jgi:phage baseplate assembly protein W
VINWSPTTAQEVVQNVETLLKTAPGTVPLARALGTPQDLVDAPETFAAANIEAAAIRAIRTYEPRVSLKTLELTATPAGKLTAHFEIVKP